MIKELREKLAHGIASGTVVPCLGPGALAGALNPSTGEPMPASSNALILAMNDGRPMSPKLMYEFPRAAMNIELKRGRAAVNRFLTRTYGETAWSRAPAHEWLAGLAPRYVIDLNRDTQLQDTCAQTPHTLITGVARIGGSPMRYRIFHWDGARYQARETFDPGTPVLFKPLGTPRPEASYIASDADYVDYLTELMGGFAIPPQLKALRQGKRYVLLGLQLDRDTERMLVNELLFGAASPAGWALIRDPSPRAQRFCERLGLEIVDAGLGELIADPALAA